MPSNPHSLLLLLLLLFQSHLTLPLPSSNSDFNSLQSFKSSADPAGTTLSSWNPSSSPCSGSWLGVSCRQDRITGLVLEGLNLTGAIQPLSLLPSLTLLSLKNNSLSSPLHLLNLSLWRPHLKLLYLSDNRFSGPFPPQLLLLRHLRRLDLAGNLLSGTIPRGIGLRLPRLLTLRCERNWIVGEIPNSLGEIRGLLSLNISYNRLAGEIPTAISSFPVSSFFGNADLCGEPVSPNCAVHEGKKRRRVVMMVVFLIVIVVVVASGIATGFLVFKKWRRKGDMKAEVRGGGGGGEDGHGKEMRLVLFEGCKGFEMEDLMRGSAEMLGRGGIGSTYRVVMELGGGGGEGGGVVVKRVRKGSLRREEVEGLLGEIGGWRHNNVVSLLAYYYSEEELLLVFDYIPNGSLHTLLHGDRGPGRTPLDWTARFKLALGAAQGLAFLHSASKSKLSHRHLTSSNILVDEGSNALISDFALHQLFTSSEPTRGNSQKCDVYSFGVILLELLTGRSEGDDGTELATWVQVVVREEWTAEVFDIELSTNKEMEDEMVALLQVALLCLAPEPKHRPKMSVVCKMIEDIKERGRKRGRGSLSPSYVNDQSSETSHGLSEDSAAFTSN